MCTMMRPVIAIILSLCAAFAAGAIMRPTLSALMAIYQETYIIMSTMTMSTTLTTWAICSILDRSFENKRYRRRMKAIFFACTNL